MTYEEIQQTQSELSEVFGLVDQAGGHVAGLEPAEAVEKLEAARDKINNVISEILGD